MYTYTTKSVDKDSMLDKVMTHVDKTSIERQKLTPNPCLLTGVQAKDDVVIVFSTFHWSEKKSAEKSPILYFYDLDGQKVLS